MWNSSGKKSPVLDGPGRPARRVPTAVAITLLAIILPNPEPNQVRVKNCWTLPNQTEHEHSVWFTALVYSVPLFTLKSAPPIFYIKI